MILTWYGGTTLKIQSGDLVCVADPDLQKNGIARPRFRGDIVLHTRANKNIQDIGAITGDPFVITEPGEYDVRTVAIRGFGLNSATKTQTSGDVSGSTLYRVTLENLILVLMGDIEMRPNTDDIMNELETVHILCMPLAPEHYADILHIARQIEPLIVVLLNSTGAKDADMRTLAQKFAAELRIPEFSEDEKITVKAKMINPDTRQCVLLTRV